MTPNTLRQALADLLADELGADPSDSLVGGVLAKVARLAPPAPGGDAVRALRFDVYDLTTPELREAFGGHKTIAVINPDCFDAYRAALAAAPAPAAINPAATDSKTIDAPALAVERNLDDVCPQCGGVSDPDYGHLSPCAPPTEAREPVGVDYREAFIAACASLARIAVALGIADEHDEGIEPIMERIAALKSEAQPRDTPCDSGDAARFYRGIDPQAAEDAARSAGIIDNDGKLLPPFAPESQP